MYDKAFVLFISATGRFYCDYKNKRVCTAWSLAGAKLFGDESRCIEAEKILNDRKIKFERKEVCISI